MRDLRVWLPEQRERVVAGSVLSLGLVCCGFPLTAMSSQQGLYGSIMALAGLALFCWISWSAMEQIRAYWPALTMRYHSWLVVGTWAAGFVTLGLVSDTTWVSGMCQWLNVGITSAFVWALRHWSD